MGLYSGGLIWEGNFRLRLGGGGGGVIFGRVIIEILRYMACASYAAM